MSAIAETIDDPELAIARLKELALSRDVVFRGHRDCAWLLQSTFSRHSGMPISHANDMIRGMLNRFYGLLSTTGKAPSFQKRDHRGRMEYARHYGLPTPLIDFTTSPYVALFFAFSGVRSLSAKSDDYSVVYALDLQATASLFAKFKLDLTSSNSSIDFAEAHRRFLYLENNYFIDGYPINELQFMDKPASWNVRMHRQMGRFLYDTLDYETLGFENLEDFLTKLLENPGVDQSASMTKIKIPHSSAKGIFRHLDLAGINGIRLLDDYEGAVVDVVNNYSYGGKNIDFWDQITGDVDA